MKAKIAICLLVSAACIAFAEDNDFKHALKQQYENHLAVLRSPYQKGDQEFDSSGKPLKDPAPGWRIYGPMLIEKLSISAKELKLEGPRVTPSGNARAIPLSKRLAVKIRLDHPLVSAGEAREVLERVFFPDADKSGYLQATYWRPDQPLPFKETINKVDSGVPIEKRVHAPMPKYTPDPDYSDEARKRKYQGRVVLRMVIDKAGTVCRVVIIRPLGYGLEEKSVEKVRTWKFAPATLEGQPVFVEVIVEVQFSLF